MYSVTDRTFYLLSCNPGYGHVCCRRHKQQRTVEYISHNDFYLRLILLLCRPLTGVFPFLALFTVVWNHVDPRSCPDSCRRIYFVSDAPLDVSWNTNSFFNSGLLLQAALGGLLIFLNGHTTSLWQDRRRLVLSVFISFAALWALFNFVNFLLPSDQPMICQATLILSTTFDQAARVAIEGFILWSLGQSTKSALERNGFAALLVIRGVGGGVFVGFTRPQFEPVCVARSELLPISIAVLALDGIILGIILIRFFTLGLWAAMSDGRSETNQEQSKALGISVVGLAIWMGVSPCVQDILLIHG